ncbi:hypothetical protein Tco_0452751 [Tanacetum coccineum]
MESNNNLNKREGLAGTFDYGDLAARMQRFNENAVILGSTQPRQAIRVLRNPNYESGNLDKPGNSTMTEAMESAFVDGDHIGVSACAGRIGPKPVSQEDVFVATTQDVLIVQSATINTNLVSFANMADGMQFASANSRSYSVSNAAPISFGESTTINPSSEPVMDVEENA